MENIDVTHPPVREELKNAGVSVQTMWKNNFRIGRVITLAGDQNYMRNAETIGRIKKFATWKTAVYSWVWGRVSETKFVDTVT